MGVYGPLRRPLGLVRVTLYVPEAHAAAVLAHAREHGMREPDVYREALSAWVERHQNDSTGRPQRSTGSDSEPATMPRRCSDLSPA